MRRSRWSRRTYAAATCAWSDQMPSAPTRRSASHVLPSVTVRCTPSAVSSISAVLGVPQIHGVREPLTQRSLQVRPHGAQQPTLESLGELVESKPRLPLSVLVEVARFPHLVTELPQPAQGDMTSARHQHPVRKIDRVALCSRPGAFSTSRTSQPNESRLCASVRPAMPPPQAHRRS